MLATWELRAAFARQLAAMYGREVPAYPQRDASLRAADDELSSHPTTTEEAR